MLSAKEHSDTAEVTVDVNFARLAIAFVILTIGLPLIGAVLQ